MKSQKTKETWFNVQSLFTGMQGVIHCAVTELDDGVVRVQIYLRSHAVQLTFEGSEYKLFKSPGQYAVWFATRLHRHWSVVGTPELPKPAGRRGWYEDNKVVFNCAKPHRFNFETQ